MLKNLEKLIVNNSLEITKNKERLENKKKLILKQLEKTNLTEKEVAEMKQQLEELDNLINMMKYEKIDKEEQ